MARYDLHLKPQPGNSYRGKCPLPTHSNEKDGNSFTATLKDNGWVWDCFSNSCIANRGGRKGGNILEFVMLMERETSLYKIGCALNEWFGLNAWLLNGSGSPGGRGGETPRKTNDESQLAKQLAPAIPAEESQTGCEENKPLGFQLQHIDHSHPYLTDRGITPETAEHFGVGFFPGKSRLLNGRIIFPIHNTRGDGNPVAYAGRSIDGVEPKYVFPPGFKKSLELYNLHRVPTDSNRIVVVEGFFTVLRFHQAGCPAVVSLMGSAASEAQIRLLAAFPRVTLCLDPDAAGRAAAASLLPALAFLTHVRVLELPGQPDELSPETITQLVGA